MLAKEIESYEERAIFLKRMFPELSVRLAGSWVWIKGNTRPRAKKLKEQGCRWSKNKEAWYLKGRPCVNFRGFKADLTYIAAKYGMEEISA